MKQNAFSIIIPVHNRWEFTNSCLKDLSFLDSDLHEIIIVDNASTDKTSEAIKDWMKKMSNLKYIRNPENYGFGKAVNIGFQKASNNLIMMLNNDIKVYANLPIWTDIYSLSLEENKNSIISPTAGFVDPRRNFQFVYETDGDKVWNYLSGWMLCGAKETFNKLIEMDNVGPFRSDLYFAYFEDTHLSFRAKELGIDLKVIPNNSVRHFGHITAKTLNLSKLYNQSKKVFIEKWSK